MTKEHFERLPPSALATFCRHVIECPEADEKTVEKAQRLKLEILSGGPPKEQQAAKRRVAAFLFEWQACLKIR